MRHDMRNHLNRRVYYYFSRGGELIVTWGEASSVLASRSSIGVSLGMVGFRVWGGGGVWCGGGSEGLKRG